MATPTGRRQRRPPPRRQAPERFPKRTSRSAARYAVFVVWLAVMAIAGGRGGLRSGGSVVFWFVVSVGLVHLVAQGLRSGPGSTLGQARAVACLLIVAATVVVFDPSTLDTFNVSKLAVVVAGAVALIALAAVEWAWAGQRPDWRNGLHWPVFALLGWTVVATLASSDIELSVLGVYGSYNGVVSTVALVAVFFVAAGTFRLADVRRVLSAVWFSVGGVVILYGFFQLHDVVWEGRWDWVRWGQATFSQLVWSTLGNPNHLAGMLAILLPLGATMLLLVQGRFRRSLVVVMLLALLVELLYTQGRGGWLGAAAALAVLLAAWAPDLRRRPRLLAAGGAALAVTVGLGLVVLGDEVDVGERISSAFELSEGTTGQRVGQWEAALDMVADRPLTGYGPETFRLHFNRRQSAEFVEKYGAEHTTAGSHNLVTDYAATLGIPGLAAFLWLLAASVRRAAGAWRAVRSAEGAGDDRIAAGVDGVDARTARLLLGGLVAAVVAFLVQSSFNLQQLALWAVFWLLLALLTVIARALDGSRSAAAVTPLARRPRVAAAVAGAGAAAVVVVAVLGTMPWRADRHYKQARGARNAGAAQLPDAPDAAAAAFQRAAQELDRASDRNGWEPTYLSEFGQLRLFMASRADDLGRDPVPLAEDAVDLFRRAVDRRPEAFELLEGYADVLLALDSVTPGGDGRARRRAVEVLEQAMERNPHSARLQEKLASARRLAGR